MNQTLYINDCDPDLIEYIGEGYSPYTQDIQDIFKTTVISYLTKHKFFNQKFITWEYDTEPTNEEWENLDIIALGIGISTKIDLTDADDLVILQAGHEGFLAISEYMEKLKEDGCLKSEYNELKNSYENDLI